jgi:predicted amidophosphoribosyltransferase
MSLLSKYFVDFSHLAFPFNCFGCGNSLDEDELPICNECEASLPLTRYWEYDYNEVAKLFWRRIPLESATSLMYFIKDGLVQELLHQLKYNGKKEVGSILCTLLGGKLKDSRKVDSYRNLGKGI